MDFEKQNAFLRLIQSAMYDATSAYQYETCERKQPPDKISVIAFAESAMAKCCAAQAMYYSNLDDLEHLDIPEVFSHFDSFVHEVITAYAENHSTQWVLIEYRKLKDSFDNSVCSQPIAK